jgi:hypothetical protein
VCSPHLSPRFTRSLQPQYWEWTFARFDSVKDLLTSTAARSTPKPRLLSRWISCYHSEDISIGSMTWAAADDLRADAIALCLFLEQQYVTFTLYKTVSLLSVYANVFVVLCFNNIILMKVSKREGAGIWIPIGICCGFSVLVERYGCLGFRNEELSIDDDCWVRLMVWWCHSVVRRLSPPCVFIGIQYSGEYTKHERAERFRARAFKKVWWATIKIKNN